MDKSPKRSRKRFHGKLTQIQPRNEAITVMLSAVEKNQFIEKCVAHSQDLSAKGRTLILAWVYDEDELALTIRELSTARKNLNEYEQKMKIDSERISFQEEQINRLLELCRKNNSSLPGEFNSYFALTDTQGSKDDFGKRESDDNDPFSLLW